MGAEGQQHLSNPKGKRYAKGKDQLTNWQKEKAKKQAHHQWLCKR